MARKTVDIPPPIRPDPSKLRKIAFPSGEGRNFHLLRLNRNALLKSGSRQMLIDDLVGGAV